MWLLDQVESLPLEQMNQRGLARPDAIREAARAVARIDFAKTHGTGSFVSPQGLVLTNQHVAHACLAANATAEADLAANGFIAPRPEAEIRCVGFELLVPLEDRDVTVEIQLKDDDALAPDQRADAREARRNRLASVCQKAAPGRRCEVVPLHGGARERLVAYEVLRDVRLAHAPEATLGVFGGENDNFEWPRHAADYAFLRAYADGKPYRPPAFLHVEMGGYEEGAFVMALGYPARTQRYLPAAEVEWRIREQIPRRLVQLHDRVRVLSKHAATSPDAERRLSARLRGFANSEKAYAGMLSGLERLGGAAARRDAERELATWIAASPETSARYGAMLSSIDRLVTARAERAALAAALDDLADGPLPLEWACAIAQRADERTRSDDARRPGFHDREDADLRAGLVDDPTPLVAPAEEELLAAILERALRLPPGSRVVAVDALAKGRQGTAAEIAGSIAKELFAATSMGDPKARERYLGMSTAQLAAAGDRLLKFAVELHRQRGALVEAIETTIEAPLGDARRLYASALLERAREAVYPDATGTLRLTHGEVAGYFPAPRGARLGYATTVPSMLAVATALHKDYALREEVSIQLAGKTLPAFVDRLLMAEPVNFISTLDTTGGASGSPVLDGYGKLLGVVFDGNYESLASGVVFDAGRSRTIAVDIRFILDLMVRVYDAAELVQEMGVGQ